MTLPAIDDYCTSKDVFTNFENKILYQMCRDKPWHDQGWITSGKIHAIGRIYTAHPSRGAGKAQDGNVALHEYLGEALTRSDLDRRLNSIKFDARITDSEVFEKVTSLHADLVELLHAASKKWNGATSNPRKQWSFASKYLHFHKPNSFPIMDGIARSALRKARVDRASGNTYKGFCLAVISYADTRGGDWYPRKIDNELWNLALGKDLNPSTRRDPQLFDGAAINAE